MGRSDSVCVIGSLNIDVVTTVDHFVKKGETITSNSFDILLGGGKGANQAVALGRLGADVRMVGRLGDLFNGAAYIDILKKNGVNYDNVKVEPGQYPGIANVFINHEGDNCIVIVPGTNALLNEEYIDKCFDSIKDCGYFLFQLETPLSATVYAMEKIKNYNKDAVIILDPAPAIDLPDSVYTLADYITPNETELTKLSGINGDIKTQTDALLQKGVKCVIAKVGENGAYIANKSGIKHVPTFKVDVADTTAAGDSFNAGFCYALIEGKELTDCVRFGNAVAALSTTKIGAQSAMPYLEQVEKFNSLQD